MSLEEYTLEYSIEFANEFDNTAGKTGDVERSPTPTPWIVGQILVLKIPVSSSVDIFFPILSLQDTSKSGAK